MHRLKAYLEAGRAEEAQRLLGARRPGDPLPRLDLRCDPAIHPVGLGEQLDVGPRIEYRGGEGWCRCSFAERVSTTRSRACVKAVRKLLSYWP
jgi:hypothetical protein